MKEAARTMNPNPTKHEDIDMMEKRDRVLAALRSEPVDRAPLSLWRHFHDQDRTAEDLAAASLCFAREYDLDLIKLTPSGLYAVEDWAGSHIVYPGTEHTAPYLRSPAVDDPVDWRDIDALEPTAGALGRELEAIRLVVDGLEGEKSDSCRGAPMVMMTIFSPLTLAFKLAGERVVDHLREDPGELHAGLEIITEITREFTRAALDAGTDGVFFATQLAGSQCLTRDEYREFGRRYDLAVLDEAKGRSAITVLHLHGEDIFFDLANTYPIDAVSWHNQVTAPSLGEARKLTSRAFITGMDSGLLGVGPERAIRLQAQDALEQTGGLGLILAPCCVIPTDAPARHLQAVREVVTCR